MKARNIIKGHLHYLAFVYQVHSLPLQIDRMVDCYEENKDLSVGELGDKLAKCLLDTHAISDFRDGEEKKYRFQWFKAAKELKEGGE